MFFVVDRDERHLRLLETALELEETDAADVVSSDDEVAKVIMMSPRAARRFRIRPHD